MYTTWIGIDPGLHGGIAVQYEHGLPRAFPMPLTPKNMIDLPAISDLIDSMLGYSAALDIIRPALIYIEGVNAMPGQGVSSTFKFGFVTGAVHGIIAAKGLSLQVVYPVRWKNRVLAGTKKDKEAAIDYCRLHFPDVNLLATSRSKKPHDGMADALCISEYARNFHQPESTKRKPRGTLSNTSA